MRLFNTAGPSVPGQHYMVDPLQRPDLPEVLALMHHLNAEGRLRALRQHRNGADGQRQRGQRYGGGHRPCLVAGWDPTMG